MRMRFFLIFTALLAVMFFHSCDQITDINLFKEAKLGQVTQEQLVAMDAETIVENSGATDAEASESFYTALSEASPSTQAAVVARLQDYFASDPQDPLWLELSFGDGEPVPTESMARRSRPTIPQTSVQREIELITLISLTTRIRLQRDLSITDRVNSASNLLAVINVCASGLLGRPLTTLNVSDLIYAMRNLPTRIYTDERLVRVIVQQLLYLSQAFSELSLDVLGPNRSRYMTNRGPNQRRNLGQMASMSMIFSLYNPMPGVYFNQYGTRQIIINPYNPQDPRNLISRLSEALFAVVNDPSFILWSNGQTMNIELLHNSGSIRVFRDLAIAAAESGLLSQILAAGSMNFNSLWPVSP